MSNDRYRLSPASDCDIQKWTGNSPYPWKYFCTFSLKGCAYGFLAERREAGDMIDGFPSEEKIRTALMQMERDVGIITRYINALSS